MAETPDRDLCAALAEGRESAYAALYDRYAPMLFRAAWSLTGSREAAEDAVQDVFVGAFRARSQLRAVASLPAYLFSALRHAAARRGARRREQAIEAIDPVAPGDSETSDAARHLEEALRRLPSDQREVVILKVDAGLTFEQISESLEISANTAASRYRYAIEKLRAILKRDR
jgi:RNA polymerase sigma-70 factor (ECF subfamily)